MFIVFFIFKEIKCAEDSSVMICTICIICMYIYDDKIIDNESVEIQNISL